MPVPEQNQSVRISPKLMAYITTMQCVLGKINISKWKPKLFKNLLYISIRHTIRVLQDGAYYNRLVQKNVVGAS